MPFSSRSRAPRRTTWSHALFGVLALALSLSAQQAPTDEALVQEICKEARLKATFSETASFVFASELPVNQTKPVMDAAEKTMDIWREITGTKGHSEFFGKDKCLVVLMKGKLQAKRFAKWYEDNHRLYWEGFADVATQGEMFPSPYPRVMIMVHLRPLKAEVLPGTVAHEVGRLLAMRTNFNNNFIPPWLEEGLGVYLESRATGRNVCYTFGGGYGDAQQGTEKYMNITPAKWKPIISKMVSRGRDKNMTAILPLRLSGLTIDEVGKARSVIDFLVQKNPKAFYNFVKAIKTHWPREVKPEYDATHREAQEKALKQSYDMTLDELDSAWRAFVKNKHKL